MRVLKYIFVIAVIVGFAAYVCIDILFPNGFHADGEKGDEAVIKTALNIGVPNNLASLPVWVAEEDSLFDSLQVSITVKVYGSQLECDKAFCEGKLNLMVTDPVRAAWLRSNRKVRFNALDTLPLDYAMVVNRKARVTKVTQLKDKMLAVARNSVYSEAAVNALDSAKMKKDSVYIVQINDPKVALHMLQSNSLDAAFMPEPYLSQARRMGHESLVCKRADFLLIAKDAAVEPKEQEKFNAAYQEALRRIKKNGINHYKDLLSRKCSNSLTN